MGSWAFRAREEFERFYYPGRTCDLCLQLRPHPSPGSPLSLCGLSLAPLAPSCQAALPQLCSARDGHVALPHVLPQQRELLHFPGWCVGCSPLEEALHAACRPSSKIYSMLPGSANLCASLSKHHNKQAELGSAGGAAALDADGS